MNGTGTFEPELAAAAAPVFFLKRLRLRLQKAAGSSCFMDSSRLKGSRGPETERKRLSSTRGATDDEFQETILERSSCRARLISIPLLRIVIGPRAVLQLSRGNSLSPADRCRRRTSWETGSIGQPAPSLVPRKSDTGASRRR